MAKSSSIRALRRALQRAFFLQKHPDLRNALADYDALRSQTDLHARREFLKASLVLGAAGLPLGAVLSSCVSGPRRISHGIAGIFTAPLNSPAALKSHDPIVILGGGLAGLCAAYRLVRAGAKVELCEAQTRLGGRVLTKQHFNGDGMSCELGGELFDSSHAEAIALAHEVGLELDDVTAQDALWKHHQFFIHGRHYSEGDLTSACAPLVRRLQRDLAGVFKSSEQRALNYRVFGPQAPRFDHMPLRRYLESATDVDRWAIEAINIAYLTEHGLDTGEQSCLNLMTLADPLRAGGARILEGYEGGTHVRGGNSRLVEALGYSVTLADSDRRVRGRINLGHHLVRIEDKGSTLSMYFARQGGGTAVFSASRVICTLPFAVLRSVSGVRELALSSTKRRCVFELGYGVNTKRAVGYRSRTLRKSQSQSPALSGVAFTDLPSQALSDSSRAQPGNSGIITACLGGRAAASSERGSVESVVSDVDRMFPGSQSFHDGNHALMRWSSDPFARCSYSCPKPGQYTTIVGSARETELGGRLLFAGEHVSEKYPGTMNGAIETGYVAAEAVLRELQSGVGKAAT